MILKLLVGRKKKHDIVAEELIQHVIAYGPPPKPATEEYWKCLTKKLFGTTSPKMAKAVCTYWYCNRGGVQTAYTLKIYACM